MEASNSLHPDAIRILVATDNHLGYLERDPIRGSDSFKTFEEILTIAEKRQVTIHVVHDTNSLLLLLGRLYSTWWRFVSR